MRHLKVNPRVLERTANKLEAEPEPPLSAGEQAVAIGDPTSNGLALVAKMPKKVKKQVKAKKKVVKKKAVKKVTKKKKKAKK